MSQQDSTPDDLLAEEARLLPIERQIGRLWLSLIDGVVPPAHLEEAWATARAIQTVYARWLEQTHAEGHAQGVQAATDAERRAAYEQGWTAAVNDIMGRTGVAARRVDDDDLTISPS